MSEKQPQVPKDGEGQKSETPKPEEAEEQAPNITMSEITESDRKLTELVKGIQAAMMRIGEPNLPVWSSEWTDSDNQVPFKAHVKAFEQLARMLDWDNNMKVLKFQMTLRGKIRQYIDTLEEATASNYDALKKDLMAIYHETRDPNTKIQEWNAIVWRPKSMKLQRLGALLVTGYKAFEPNKSGEQNELMLKNRFLKAIEDGHPKFSRYIELNRSSDVNQSYKDLVTWCAEKFRIFKRTSDMEEEEDDVAALLSAESQQNEWKDERYDDEYRDEYNDEKGYNSQYRGQKWRPSDRPVYPSQWPDIQHSRDRYAIQIANEGQGPRSYGPRRESNEDPP